MITYKIPAQTTAVFVTMQLQGAIIEVKMMVCFSWSICIPIGFLIFIQSRGNLTDKNS